MKAILMSALCFGIITSQAIAADHNYLCIADSLAAYNSDIYYDLSNAEIDTMFNDINSYGHNDVVRVAQRCDIGIITTKQYQCIADTLQAYNSDIFYNLSSSEVDDMLKLNEAYGHDHAISAAKRCGVKGATRLVVAHVRYSGLDF